jgi:VWFA-related protein
VALGAVLGVSRPSAQQVPFQAAVDLVVADVQVLDRDGRPVVGLTPDQFDVSIGGKKQRVVSAELLDFAGVSGTTSSGTAAAPTSRRPDEGRLFLIAVDTMSFPPDVSAGVMSAARAFLRNLEPTDLVGLHAYPQGPKIDPTTDHVSVGLALSKVVGARSTGNTSQFRIRPSEIVDLAMSLRTQVPDRSAEAVINRECGNQSGQNPDRNCPNRLKLEVESTVALLQSVAETSVGGLRQVLQSLQSVPGRKTVIVLTSGMLASDRPGGRPDITDLALEAGHDAARSNATVYSIFVDAQYLERNSAEMRKGNLNTFANYLRDTDTMSSWHDKFSGSTGGMMVRDLIGRGEIGFRRIIQETSAYYRIGIDPASVKRSAKPQRMQIKVSARNATVRGRNWVVVPYGRN